MNELQLQKPSKPTSVRVPPATKHWLRKNVALGLGVSDLVKLGPAWHDKMIEQAQELREARENIEAAQKRLAKLYEENDELRKFKARTLERVKTEGLLGGRV